jgi:hypothetical protein
MFLVLSFIALSVWSSRDEKSSGRDQDGRKQIDCGSLSSQESERKLDLWLQGSANVAFLPSKILPIHREHIMYNDQSLN